MNQLKIIKSILNEGDIVTINQISKKAEWIFPDENNQQFFNFVKDYTLRYGKPPSTSYIESQILMGADQEFKDVFNELQGEEIEDPLPSMVEQQIFYNIKNRYFSLDEKFKEIISNSNLDAVMPTIKDFIGELSTTVSSVIMDDADITSFKDDSLYLEEKAKLDEEVRDDYFLSKFGIPAIDEKLGGLKKGDDFITILASAKQYKSTLLRFLVYKQIMQGVNSLFISLEMSAESIKNYFIVLHANNTERWGHTKPPLTIEHLKHKNTMDDETKEFYLEVIRDLFENDAIGELTIIAPKKQYAYEDFERDVKEYKYKYQLNNKQLGIVALDYVTLILPRKKGRIDTSDYNNMIRAIRLLMLEEGIVLITPIQANRAAYNKIVNESKKKNSNNDNLDYSLDDIFMYSELEKSMTNGLYILQSPDMKPLNQVKIGSVIHREAADIDPIYAFIDYRSGHFRTVSNSKMDDEEIISVITELEI
jgi:hypothetical protein